MPMLGDNEFFLGHARSWEDPCGEMLEEYQHPNGSWLGIFQSTRRYTYGEFFVVYRENRKCSKVEVVQPKERYGTHKMIDADFLNWEWKWGFGEDRATARKYLDYLLSCEEHPAVHAPFKRSRPRDAQRDKVYTWEHKFYRNADERIMLTRDEVEGTIRCIEGDFPGLTKRRINVIFRKGRYCTQNYNTIKMAPWGYHIDVIVHEMAHWVTEHYLNKIDVKEAGHGPHYVGIFMLMMAYYQGYSLPDMINHAMDMKIKFRFPEGGLATLMEREELREAA